MQVAISLVDNRLILRLQGRLDSNASNEFRQTIDAALKDDAVKEVEVDMGGVDYIDSTGLGLLLVLRAEARNRYKAVRLANCRGPIKVALDIANFNKIFTMD